MQLSAFCFLLVIYYTVSIPLSSDITRRKRSEEESEDSTTTTQITFAVERLDAPIERIEIRLIDENITKSTQNEEEEEIPRKTEIIREEANNNDSGQLSHITETNVQRSTILHRNEDIREETVVTTEQHETSHHESFQSKYKKVEYVNDDHVETTTTPPSTEERENDMKRQADSQRDHLHGAEEQYTPQNAAKEIWFLLSTRSPGETLFDGDIGDLPPEVEKQAESEDDEPETVEECLANRRDLSEDTVNRLQTQATKLARLIRKLNRQQQQYCVDKEHEEEDEYRQCPIWREEKFVHYYKLMRISYCADYSKWPNAEKIKKQYKQYLPLFETLYAFQKQ